MKPNVTTAPASTANTNGGGSATATATPEDGGDEETKTPAGNTGGGSTAQPACTLLTEARAEEVMGSDVNQTVATDTECTYEGVEDFGVSVDLTVRTGTHQEMADYFSLPIGETEPVDGVGEQAHWSSGVNVLEVLQGNFDFQLQVLNLLSGGGNELDHAKALAGDVSDQLP